MSCPNFHKVNARNFYAVSDKTTHFDENDNEVEAYKDSFDWEMDEEFACERGKEKGFTPSETYVRSMNGSSFMEKETWLQWGTSERGEFCVTEQIFMHSGYYSGANYDWDICISDCYGGKWNLSEYDSEDDFLEDIVDSWKENASYDWNEGLVNIHAKNIRKWLEKVLDNHSDMADNMCKEICDDELACVGIFSNGEAVYEKVAA